MTRISSRLLTAGLTLALALPGVAQAHRGHHGHFGHFHARNVPCHAIENGRTPAWLTTDQVDALKQACTTRDAAVKAANTTFKTDTADARSTYQDTAKPLYAEISAAAKAKRDACRADHASQACADARDAYRTTVKADFPKIRSAWRTYVTAVRPAAKTRNQAIRAANKTFRQAAKAALAS